MRELPKIGKNEKPPTAETLACAPPGKRKRTLSLEGRLYLRWEID
jgi:hypothetical protein